MRKESTMTIAATGLALGAAAGMLGLWATHQNTHQMKKVAKKAAHAAEHAVMGLDKLAREYR